MRPLSTRPILVAITDLILQRPRQRPHPPRIPQASTPAGMSRDTSMPLAIREPSTVGGSYHPEIVPLTLLLITTIIITTLFFFFFFFYGESIQSIDSTERGLNGFGFIRFDCYLAGHIWRNWFWSSVLFPSTSSRTASVVRWTTSVSFLSLLLSRGSRYTSDRLRATGNGAWRLMFKGPVFVLLRATSRSSTGVSIRDLWRSLRLHVC